MLAPRPSPLFGLVKGLPGVNVHSHVCSDSLPRSQVNRSIELQRRIGMAAVCLGNSVSREA